MSQDNPTPADAEKLDNFEHLLLSYDLDNVSVRLKLEGGSITPEEAEARYKEVQDRLCEKVAALIDAVRIDQMNYVDQRLIGKDTSGERVFYDKDAVIAENKLKAQQRIISDAMKAELSHPAPVHKSDKE